MFLVRFIRDVFAESFELERVLTRRHPGLGS